MTRFLITTFAMTIALSGCALEASHELLPSSPLPRGIAHDPRMRGLGPVHVTTDSYTDGTVVATVTSREHRGRFKVRGTIAALAPPQEHSEHWRETYNGETDVFAYVLPDYYFIRVVPHP